MGAVSARADARHRVYALGSLRSMMQPYHERPERAESRNILAHR